MGRRARARAQAATGAKPTTASERTAASPPARQRLDPVRRTLVAYLGAALVLATLTLAGILVLGGTLGPFVTLAVVAVGAGLVHRAATARLATASLTGEDRMMQTMAGGMLVLSVVLAAAGAVVATLA
ncbi:MAG: hypothetical protein M3417_12340 [Actinomycetota bacterium]|nr:hypothetical protein [Actinomycetota bacterium]